MNRNVRRSGRIGVESGQNTVREFARLRSQFEVVGRSTGGQIVLPSVTVQAIEQQAHVVTTFGLEEPGLVLGDFTVALDRIQSGVVTPAPEALVLFDMGGGDYSFRFTPLLVGVLYRLRLDRAGSVVTPSEFQNISTSHL